MAMRRMGLCGVDSTLLIAAMSGCDDSSKPTGPSATPVAVGVLTAVAARAVSAHYVEATT